MANEQQQVSEDHLEVRGKRKRHYSLSQHHFITGIGDGDVHKYDIPGPDSIDHTALRNRRKKVEEFHNRNSNNRMGHYNMREDLTRNNPRHGEPSGYPKNNGEGMSYFYPRDTENDHMLLGQKAADHSLFQASLLVFMVIFGILVAIFFNLSNKSLSAYRRRRAKKNGFRGKGRTYHRSSEKPFSRTTYKKTDSWSEDEGGDDLDLDYHSDGEENVASHDIMMDPLYYPHHGVDGYYHQKTRLRKVAGGSSTVRKSSKKPVMSRKPIERHYQKSIQEIHDVPKSVQSRTGDIGLGLDGFGAEKSETNHFSAYSARTIPQKTSSPSEAISSQNLNGFASPWKRQNSSKTTKIATTNVGSTSDNSEASSQTSSPALSTTSSHAIAMGDCESLSEDEVQSHDERFPVSHVQSRTLQDATCLGSTSYSSVPFVANQMLSIQTSNHQSIQYEDDDDVIRSPRSIPVEELKLIQMESGFNGVRWKTAISNKNRPKSKLPLQLHRKQENDKNSNCSVQDGETSQCDQDNLKRRCKTQARENSTGSSTGETEGANGVMHKRKDLTAWTDAASSLTSPIPYSELKLQSIIGSGGFGQVWEARWRGTPVAVKLLVVTSQSESVQQNILQEFAAEINMVSGMRHPNICLYIGACLQAPNRAIVTELATNGSLWDALRKPLQPPFVSADGKTRAAWSTFLYPSTGSSSAASDAGKTMLPYPPVGTWPWELVKRVAAGAARGINYLHCGQPAVLHRDLKSANILLDESYNAKVADFGLSRLKAQTRSMTGNCGTVQWMAPEILSNESYAEPSDVYSYGIILWELLVRECPYEGMSPIQCALAVLNDDSRPKVPDWCPPTFVALITMCLERDPRLRPTFSQILSALDSMPSGGLTT